MGFLHSAASVFDMQKTSATDVTILKVSKDTCSKHSND